MNAAQLLQSPQRNLDEKGRKYIDMILIASKRASELISKLMTFGQSGSLSKSCINMDDILNDIIDLLYEIFPLFWTPVTILQKAPVILSESNFTVK